MEMKLTRHAEKRMKERLGIKSSKQRMRMASLALSRGKLVDVEDREWKGSTEARMVLEYGEGLYVFARDLSLVTVLEAKRKKCLSRDEALTGIMVKESRQAIAYA